ncbi:MAG: hypothetical protein QM757_41490 [Paludibaculum sp.]
MFTLFLSIGIWYNCTNQFIVQRCLGARSEWDARMGVIFAGFMKLLLPFLVVIPGIVAFQLFPGLTDPDQAYPRLVKELVPLGLGGVVMAGIASALLSHLSSVLNSCSTVFTMDLYRPFFGQGKGDAHLVSVGRWSGFLILTFAMGLAIWFTRGQHSVFLVIQNVGSLGGCSHRCGLPSGRVVEASHGAGQRRSCSSSAFPTQRWWSMSCSSRCPFAAL